MKLEFDPELDDILVNQIVLAKFLRMTDRGVRKARDNGVLLEVDGKFPLIENLHLYFGRKSGEIGSDEQKSEDQMRKEKLYEETRKLKFDNDLKAGVVAPVSEIVSVVRPLITMLSQKIDLLPGIAADACKEVDGRGRERMAKALVTEKNELARIPERLLNTSTTVVN